MILLPCEKILLELLQAALWKKTPEGACACFIAEKTWQEVYDLSVKQGVLAIAFDGIKELPESCRPPKAIRLQWAANVKAMENRYDRHVSTVVALNRFYREKGIKTLFLKGIGLASMYPKLAHREFGDIDVWLFGDFEKGNQAILDSGGEVDFSTKKHSSFYFEQIPVENHKTLLDVCKFKVDKKLEHPLQKLLEKEGEKNLLLGNNETVLVPSSIFNILFNARHITIHCFPGKIVLRHLCDWGRLLYTQKDLYDKEKAAKIFHDTGMNRMVEMITRLTVKYIGLPQEYAPLFCRGHEKKIDTIAENVLCRMLRSVDREDCPYGGRCLRKIVWKTKRMLKDQQMYTFFRRASLRKRIVRSVKWHDNHPRNFFN